MIGDPAGVEAVFSDQELQDVLDHNRAEARSVELSELQTIAPGGAVTIQNFYATLGDWEEEAELVDGSYNVLTPSTADWMNGRWAFSIAPTRPVLITGFYYDLAGAAAAALEHWIAREKNQTDLRADDLAETRSQRVSHLVRLADRYRRQAWLGSGRMIGEAYASCR